MRKMPSSAITHSPTRIGSTSTITPSAITANPRNLRVVNSVHWRFFIRGPIGVDYGLRLLCAKSHSLNFFSVQPLCSLCLRGLLYEGRTPRRHRGHRGCTEKKFASPALGQNRLRLLTLS